MYNHAPPDYICPICIALEGKENEDTLIVQSDIIYRDELVMAFISSFFIGNSPGHVVIVPNKHFENIYDLPQDYANRIQGVARKVALAVKDSYQAKGITTLQNNEPVGGQHAFHYHLHVFPRFSNDELFKNMLEKKNTTPIERKPYADKLKAILED